MWVASGTGIRGLRISDQRTVVTALSKAVETPPPRDIETTVGRPEARAWVNTQLRPDTLKVEN